MTIVNLSDRKFKAEEFVGETIAIGGHVDGYRKTVKTVHGPREAYVADIAILTGEEAGLFFDNVLVFNQALVSQIQRAEKDSHGEDRTVIGELLWVTTQDGERSYPLVETEGVSPKLIALASKFGI